MDNRKKEEMHTFVLQAAAASQNVFPPVCQLRLDYDTFQLAAPFTDITIPGTGGKVVVSYCILASTVYMESWDWTQTAQSGTQLSTE